MSAVTAGGVFEIVNAADCFKIDGAKIRKTDENPPRISVHDVIKVITGDLHNGK